MGGRGGPGPVFLETNDVILIDMRCNQKVVAKDKKIKSKTLSDFNLAIIPLKVFLSGISSLISVNCSFSVCSTQPHFHVEDYG